MLIINEVGGELYRLCLNDVLIHVIVNKFRDMLRSLVILNLSLWGSVIS